jgi:superfamily II DNA or RNA helicase
MCELDLPLKFAQKLYQEFSVRHPNAFYLRTRQRDMQNWDGKIHYINKHGEFKIGFLPAVYEKCIEYGIKPKVVDMRKPLPKVKKVVTKIGKYKLRPEQEKAVKAIISNQVGNSLFQIGVLDYTVNAGKTLIMSSLYLSYKRQLKTLLITNDSDWLNQAREEFKQYLPGEDITFVQGKVLNWSNFTIGMVQSISRNMRFYQQELSKIDMVLVDEADQGGSKQYQNVLTRLFNTRIRIGLSGTIYMSKLAKDKVKNMNLECFFGKVIAEFKLKDSIKKGYSTKTIVKMVPSRPWYGNWESEFVTYKDIYDDSITLNKYAKRMAYARLKWNINQGRYPALVVCKHIAHCENLYKFFKKKLGDAYNIAYVHVNTPSKLRQQIMKDFREGRIDILVSTTIIARGKNFPKLRYLLNAASMDSQEKSIQFLGRLVRTDESKNRVYLDDLHYPGDYLSRHGRHRKQYYQKQELKVILLEKLWKNHPIHSL